MTNYNEIRCSDCGAKCFNGGLVRRGKVWKCEDCWEKPRTPMTTKTVEEIVKEIDPQFEELFNKAVRQCMRLVKGMQTEKQMEQGLATLNLVGLEIIRTALTNAFEQGRDIGMKADEELREEGRQEGYANVYNAIPAFISETTDHARGYNEGIRTCAKAILKLVKETPK
jgi:hypothetical protein